MKTTSKATLLKTNNTNSIRPIVLTNEKLARSRLFAQLKSSQRSILNVTNSLLMPIIRQGHSALETIKQDSVPEVFDPNIKQSWFTMMYQGNTVAWWSVDRSTLDQLASCYYGSPSSPAKSPLLPPSNSEFRLAKRFMLGALKALPDLSLDPDDIELTLLTSASEINAQVIWTMNFAKESYIKPMHFCVNEQLLGLLSNQPTHQEPALNLAEKLKEKSRQIPVQLKVELGKANTSMTELNQLRPGDILPLTLHAHCPVKVTDHHLYDANIYTDQGQMIAKITKVQDEEKMT
ncbi:FliM/FliN family flagellar motor switch protein [Shewanella sp. 202IG2-18]|uniref:FliM/FliN family flagellar motor switch protein n=1 Tax=Parashewanella hymeniacidonis TaxID=2807618 RepID=UPI001960992D|nr:FliM/FliN family flagellar motor switch protein [Parashewanella hymeniacidonis]MBM7071619.1 FliM/FliN family flagellar motor switch protein [Parashewanella hymeniacidonis]